MTKPATHRTCNVCNIEKPVAEFPLRSSRCSLCVKGRTPRTRTHRVCHTCNIDKLASEYNGTATKCRLCVESGVKGNGDFKSGPKGKGIIKCPRCGEMKPHRAKGFCDACWQLNRLEELHSDPNYHQSVEHKVCQRCNIDKSASEFPKLTKAKDGLQAWCKMCVAKYHAVQRQNPEWIVRERKRARDAFSTMDEDKKRAKHDKNYETEKERLKTSPEYRKRKNFQMTRKNLRRKKLIKAGAQHTLKEWEALCEKYNYKCLWCGKRKPLSEDHVLPLTMGGADTIDNIQPLCLSCNSRKNNRYMDFRPKV